jgi:hypothetical protein
MPDLLDMQNTLTYNEVNDTDTFEYTKPWDDHTRAHVQVKSEVPELSKEEIANMQMQNLTRNNHTLISFDFNSQDKHWSEKMSQAKLALMKAYAAEVIDPKHPEIGQGEDHC